MTNMQIQKQRLINSAIKDVKAIRHLTGNSSEAQEAQAALELLKAVL